MFCPACKAESRVTLTSKNINLTHNGANLFGNKRRRICLVCQLQWDTFELCISKPERGNATDVMHSATQSAIQLRNERRANEAMAAGRPMVLYVQCPHCGIDGTNGTIRSTDGAIGENYWRSHRCKHCAEWFYTATDLADGTVTILRKAVPDREKSEKSFKAQRGHVPPVPMPTAAVPSIAFDDSVPEPADDDAAAEAEFKAITARIEGKKHNPPTPTASEPEPDEPKELGRWREYPE